MAPARPKVIHREGLRFVDLNARGAGRCVTRFTLQLNNWPAPPEAFGHALLCPDEPDLLRQEPVQAESRPDLHAKWRALGSRRGLGLSVDRPSGRGGTGNGRRSRLDLCRLASAMPPCRRSTSTIRALSI